MNVRLQRVAAWINSCDKRSDRDRAAYQAKRLRQTIDLYNALIDADGWLTTSDVMKTANCGPRAARRLMYQFDAAGYVDLETSGTIGQSSRIRITRKTVVSTYNRPTVSPAGRGISQT